jgi:hypothetical protein
MTPDSAGRRQATADEDDRSRFIAKAPSLIWCVGVSLKKMNSKSEPIIHVPEMRFITRLLAVTLRVRKQRRKLKAENTTLTH